MLTAIIQARMGSSRLPGKILKEIDGKPMLQHVVERVELSESVAQVVIATTTASGDNKVAEFFSASKFNCFRGSQADVLDRYYQASLEFGANPIVRVTGDCPLIDPDVIDRVAGTFQKGNYDYVSNINPPTYPDGLDVEIFSLEVLKEAWENAKLKSEREHVTLYVRNRINDYQTKNIHCDRELSHLRWTVDEAEDLEFVRRIYRQLSNPRAGYDQVLSVIEDDPQLKQINQSIERDEGLEKSLKNDEKMKKRNTEEQ